jgi:hypoxanthine phosphoribosyltransferase
MVNYSGVNEKNEKPKIISQLNIELNNLKVLLVDDVADSGTSLLLAKKYIGKLGASGVKIATLHIKPWSSFKPDYYGEESESWIIYPWEINETIKEITKKLRREGKNREEIIKNLRKIGFTQNQVKRYYLTEYV